MGMTYVCQDCGQHVIGATIHKCKSATSANRTYQAIQSGGDIEKINYISVGKTIGIWVTIDGEQVLFVKEPHLREQIAKEIAEHRKNFYEQYPAEAEANTVAFQMTMLMSNVDESIARGNPNV